MDITRFRNIFDGYTLAYGVLGALEEDDTGKMQGRNVMIRNTISDENFEKHLNGTGQGIRLIPLKDNKKLRYAAIDLDKKCLTNPLKHTIQEMEDKVKKLKIPLIPCQSKSGDIHLYCFAKEDINPKLFMSRIHEWASLLGYGAAEKFPKQTSRANKDDVGLALNLPYYGNTRLAFNKHKPLSLEEFMDYAEAIMVTEEELREFKCEGLDESYDDAPPCLQKIASDGIDDGGRNNGLFSLAVYYHKKYPDNFEEKIMEANGKYFRPSLGYKEVETIIKSVHKKEFFYKCDDSPCVQLCNKIECYKRKYGVGNSSGVGEITFDNLTKHVSHDSVRWYAEIRGSSTRVQLTTEELLNQRLLQKKIAEVTTKMVRPMKADKWHEVVANLFNTCEVIEDPEDASRTGQFKEHAIEWLSDFTHGQTKNDLVKKRGTYFDQEDNIIYFKSAKLMAYLKGKNFTCTPNEVWTWTKDMLQGATHKMSIGGVSVRCWSIPAPKVFTEDLL